MDRVGLRPGPDVAVARTAVAPGTSAHTMLVHSVPRRDEHAVAAWIGAAVERGERVLCRHAPQGHRRLLRMLDGLGLGGAGPVVLMDTAATGARCAGRHAALLDLHTALAERAVRDGFTGLAVTTDHSALDALCPDRGELVAHERDLAALTTDRPVRALCCYHCRAPLVTEMLAVHHRDVDDDLWTACVDRGRLLVCGEIDASNADRLRHVLIAGLAEGVRKVGLADLRFCAVTGVRVFLAAADTLAAAGRELVLVDVDPMLARNFALTGGDRPRGLRLVTRRPE